MLPIACRPFIAVPLLMTGMLLGQGKSVSDKNGVVSLPIPEGYQLGKSQPVEIGDKPGGSDVVTFQLGKPGAAQVMVITAQVVNGTAFHLAPSIFDDRVYFDSYKDAEKAEVASDPRPHIVVYIRGKGERLLVVLYRKLVGRNLKLLVRCDQNEWKTSKAALFGMLDGAQTKLAPFPGRKSAGRKEKEKKGIVFSVADDVKDRKAGREVESVVLDIQKSIEAIHGPIQRPEGNPLVIYVNSLMADHKLVAFGEQVAPAILGTHRVFTVPLKDRGDRDRKQFVHLVCEAMLWELYGGRKPLWLGIGERMIAEQLDLTKKKLPAVEKGFLESVKLRQRFEELAGKKEIPADDFWAECFAYVSMFHAGPKEYREAYRAFQKEFQATGDGNGATKKHLLSLDQNKMREDARTWVKKLRGAKIR